MSSPGCDVFLIKYLFFVTLSTSAIKLRLLAFQQHRAQVRQQELSETRYENRANRGEL